MYTLDKVLHGLEQPSAVKHMYHAHVTGNFSASTNVQISVLNYLIHLILLYLQKFELFTIFLPDTFSVPIRKNLDSPGAFCKLEPDNNFMFRECPVNVSFFRWELSRECSDETSLESCTCSQNVSKEFFWTDHQTNFEESTKFKKQQCIYSIKKIWTAVCSSNVRNKLLIIVNCISYAHTVQSTE